MKKAVLIFPRPISEMPTGFAYLNSVFKQKGYEVKAIVNTFKKNYSTEDILKTINEYKPYIVGLNIGTLAVLETYKLIKAVDKKETIIIAGGPHATTCPEEVLENGVDIVIRNEGEETLAELLDNIDGNTEKWLEDIPGISYVFGTGKAIHNPQRPYIKDLKDLPEPDFSCFNYEDFKTSDGLVKGLHRIYCSRGCVGTCLTGGTIIHTIEGDLPIKDLVGKEIKILTRDPITQYPIYKEAIHIKKIKENAEIIRVHFTNGSYIDCTPDHKFKVFKSKNQFITETEWDVEAVDLLPKQQVRAISITNNKGRISLLTRRNISIARDRLVMESIIGRKLLSHEWVHHLDKDPSNDIPTNLILTTDKKHITNHHPEISERMKINNPMKNHEVVKKQKEVFRKRFKEGKIKLIRTLEQRFRYRESKLGIKNPRYNESLTKHQTHKSRIPEINHKIDFIEKLPYRDDVYCLEVPGINWFYANKVLVHNCTFCDSAIFGHKVRYRPINGVIKEIKFRYENYGIDSFIIADDTFTTSKQYVKEFCRALKDNNLPIIWGCSTRASAVNDEILQIMKDAGCYLIGFGIESGDPNTLKEAKKGITLEQAHKAIDITSKYGFRIYVNLMIGFPWETEEAVQNQIRYIKQHFNQVYIYQVSGSLVPYPGTGIYNKWKNKANIKEWWLRPSYQNYGIQIHQNSTEPYKLNTYYQRKLYDDTYVWEDIFFKYTKGYKNLVKQMAFLIGKRNLLSEEPSIFKRKYVLTLCKLSRFFYELFPNLEKKIIPVLVNIFNLKSSFHDHGPLGYIRRKVNE